MALAAFGIASRVVIVIQQELFRRIAAIVAIASAVLAMGTGLLLH